MQHFMLVLFSGMIASCGSTETAVQAASAMRQELFGESDEINLEIPNLVVDEALNREKARFEGALHSFSSSLVQCSSVLAPFGGSRVTALRELNCQRLVIVDSSGVGATTSVVASFTKDQRQLARALQQGIEGSMGSGTVSQAPLAAQILGRLALELNVKHVKVTYIDPALDGDRPATLADWDLGLGWPPEQRTGPTLVTHFAFRYANRATDIVLISRRIMLDQATDQPALPIKLLTLLSTSGFSWNYISADWVMLFSKCRKEKSAEQQQVPLAQQASLELVEMLAADGSVILDYPDSSEGDHFPERLPLDPWGFSLAWQWYFPGGTSPRNVFGYVGASAGEVRIYQIKGGHTVWRKQLSSLELGAWKIVNSATFNLRLP